MRQTLVILFLLIAVSANAKPLITNSEQTLVSVCTGYDDTDERLLQICAEALTQPGLTSRKRAQVLTAHGDALRWLDRHEEARGKFLSAIEADQAFADAHEGLGWVNWVKEDYQAAIENFQSALDVSPSSDALAGLASAQYKDEQISAQEAITLLAAALAIEPDNEWALRQKGWVEIDELDYEAARETFQAAVDLHDADADALDGLALSHHRLDDDEAALEAINAAVAADPEEFWYLQRRSMILLSLDRPAAALRDAESYLDQEPDSATGFVRQGRALDALGRTQEGLSVMAVARARLPRDDFLDYWYARTLSNDGQKALAWSVMSYHLTQATGDFWDYVLLAFLAVETDRLDEATKAVGHLKDLRPEHDYTHYWDAVTRVHKGDVDGAEAQIRLAVQQGMSDSLLSDFVEHMVGQGLFIRAAALRLQLKQEALSEQ